MILDLIFIFSEIPKRPEYLPVVNKNVTMTGNRNETQDDEKRAGKLAN